MTMDTPLQVEIERLEVKMRSAWVDRSATCHGGERQRIRPAGSFPYLLRETAGSAGRHRGNAPPPSGE